MEPYDLLKYMVKAFESLGIRYFITGSIASIFYGEPRFTNDKIDMAYIEYWAKKLDLLDIWNAILQRFKKT